jgi:hypothetical protein
VRKQRVHVGGINIEAHHVGELVPRLFEHRFGLSSASLSCAPISPAWAAFVRVNGSLARHVERARCVLHLQPVQSRTGPAISGIDDSLFH